MVHRGLIKLMISMIQVTQPRLNINRLSLTLFERKDTCNPNSLQSLLIRLSMTHPTGYTVRSTSNAVSPFPCAGKEGVLKM